MASSSGAPSPLSPGDHPFSLQHQIMELLQTSLKKIEEKQDEAITRLTKQEKAITKAMGQLQGLASLATIHLEKEFRLTLGARTSESRVVEFKKLLMQTYFGTQKPTYLECMVTGFSLPVKEVKAAHVFPMKMKDYLCALLHVTDINDVRNGVLWCDPIEQVFSCGKICFSWCSVESTFILHVLDQGILKQTLIEYSEVKTRQGSNYESTQTTVKAYESVTFEDLDQQRMVFKFTKLAPWKRAFTFMAKLAIRQARERNTLPDAFAEEDWDWAVSDNGWTEATKVWFETADFNEPPEMDSVDEELTPSVVDSAEDANSR